jgi:hypothetical protein
LNIKHEHVLTAHDASLVGINIKNKVKLFIYIFVLYKTKINPRISQTPSTTRFMCGHVVKQ